MSDRRAVKLLKLFAENPNRPLNRDWLLESMTHREIEEIGRAIDEATGRVATGPRRFPPSNLVTALLEAVGDGA